MSILIEKVSNRIYLRAAYPVKGLAKKVPGARWRAGEGVWSIPLNMASCTLLRELFGNRLDIGPELWAWAKEQREASRRIAALRSSKRAELRRLPAMFPELARAVTVNRPYQSVGAKWIAEGKRVLIADTVGLGKTPQALAGIVESGVSGPYLVVCPKTAVESVWAPEIGRWLPSHAVITLPDNKGKREDILRDLATEGTVGIDAWLIVNPEVVRTKTFWDCGICGKKTPFTHGPKKLDCLHDPGKAKTVHEHDFPALFEIPWGAIIADESDKSILRLKGKPSQKRRGMEMLRDNMDRMRPDGIRVAQSGTPFRSRPHLLWSTLNWLFPEQYTSFTAWAETLFEVRDGWGGSRVIGNLRGDRENLLYQQLDSVMLRRTRQEVAAHLPKRMYLGTPLDPSDPSSPVGIWLPMEDGQRRAYEQMLRDSVAEIEGGTLNAIGHLAVLTRLKQFAVSAGKLEYDGSGHPVFKPTTPSNKLEYVKQVLVELGYPDDPQSKIVIVSQFTEILRLFRRELEKVFGRGMITEVTGSVTGNKRQEAIASFNEPLGTNSPHIMLLNTHAGGAAITLDAADEMIFLDQTWVPDDQEQAEGRIDNRRPEEKIVQRRYRYLYSKESIDEAIALVNATRAEGGQRILDGRRGVEFAREIVQTMTGTVTA